MARYSDSASPDEAVVIETDDFALVYDRRNRAFHKKRWDSSTKSWTTKVAPYSAIVCKDGSTVWAEDASGKTIASGESGVDDASVIQSAINNDVVILRGDFSLDKTIEITNSGSTVFLQGSIESSANPIFYIHGSFEGWNYVGKVRVQGLGRNVHIKGNYNNDAIFIEAATQIHIENLRVHDCKRGVVINGLWGSQSEIKEITFYSMKPGANEALLHILKPPADTSTDIIFEDIGFDVREDADPSSWAVRIDDANARFMHFKDIDAEAVYNGVYIQGHNIHITRAKPRCDRGGVGLVLKGHSHIVENLYETKGILLDGADRCTIAHCRNIYAEKNGNYCVDIKDSTYNNLIDINTAPDAQAIAGFKLEGETYWNILRDCRCVQLRGKYAIHFAPNARLNKIIHPHIRRLNYKDDYPASECFIVYNEYFDYTFANRIFNPHNWDNIDHVSGFINDVRGCYIKGSKAEFKTEKSGTATFSGDGSTTDFEIGAHDLFTTDPSKIAVKVTPISSDAIAASPCVGYVDPADNTKIRVKFSSAPASGSGNVKIVWYAEVIS